MLAVGAPRADYAAGGANYRTSVSAVKHGSVKTLSLRNLVKQTANVYIYILSSVY